MSGFEKLPRKEKLPSKDKLHSWLTDKTISDERLT